MSLVGPWLNDIGSKRKKKKYASAEAKKKDLELQAEWSKLLQQIDSTVTVIKNRPYNKTIPKLGPPPGRETPFIPSHNSGAAVAAKKASPVYTGNKIIGIGTMHKSNAVPIFSDDEAKAISSMRR